MDLLQHGNPKQSLTKNLKLNITLSIMEPENLFLIDLSTCVAINKSFSRTGTNYRDLLNYHGILNSNNVIQTEWSKKLIPLHNDVKTLQELIEINNNNINVYFRHKVHMLHIENLYIQCYNK